MEELVPEAILDGLCTDWLGRRIVAFEAIDSTNRVAKSMAQQGAPEGTLVIADEQTAGRGRLGRRWLAPRGTSLLFSLIFRPAVEVRRAQGLTMICGLGVRQAIRIATGLPAQLKWPNDILLRGRKAGGILTELGLQAARLDYAVVGIGLNVNLDVAALPSDWNATSIQQELGHAFSRVRLLQEALLYIEERYRAWQAGEWPLKEWAAALDTLGQRVQLHTADGTWQGVAENVDEEGALLLRLDNGQLQRVFVGDITPPSA